MKIATNIAGGLLGFLFIVFSLIILLNLITPPEIPEGTPMDHFMKAFGPTGWMTLVKVCELLGGILVAIPKTRNFGLLILGPIIINIAAFHLLVEKEGFVGIPLFLAVLGAFLLWAERKSFLALLH